MAKLTIKKEFAGYHPNMSRRSSSILYICDHYTASLASARNNCIYFAREGAKTNASADFFIELDGTVYQYNGNPSKYYCWAVGDGHGEYGITNNNSISIELVNDGSEAFTDAQITALKLLHEKLMKEHGLGPSSIKRHWDASRKECPYYYRGNNSAAQKRWEALRKKIGGTSTTTKSTKTTSSSKKSTSTFPLASGHYFGKYRSRNENHSGRITGDEKYVKMIQKKVGVTADGIFGDQTDSAVKKWQKKNSLTADGLVGAKTWAKMFD